MSMDAQGNVYIGDRSNARVQVWDNDLNPKAIYDQDEQRWISDAQVSMARSSNAW